MSGTGLARIVALGSVLAKQERAAAAAAAQRAADAEDAAERERLAHSRAANARARGGELAVFLAGQVHGAALAHAASDAAAAALTAAQAQQEALEVLRAHQVRLKAVERLADARRADADAARQRALTAVVDDVVIARYARTGATA